MKTVLQRLNLAQAGQVKSALRTHYNRRQRLSVEYDQYVADVYNGSRYGRDCRDSIEKTAEYTGAPVKLVHASLKNSNVLTQTDKLKICFGTIRSKISSTDFDKSGSVYLFKLTSIDGRIEFKIGIAKDVERRRVQIKTQYGLEKVEVIHHYRTNDKQNQRLKAWIMEQTLLYLFSPHGIQSSIIVAGRNECLDKELPVNQVTEVMKVLQKSFNNKSIIIASDRDQPYEANGVFYVNRHMSPEQRVQMAKVLCAKQHVKLNNSSVILLDTEQDGVLTFKFKICEFN